MDRNCDVIILKTQKKLKELKLCVKIQSLSVFLDIAKFADSL